MAGLEAARQRAGAEEFFDGSDGVTERAAASASQRLGLKRGIRARSNQSRRVARDGTQDNSARIAGADATPRDGYLLRAWWMSPAS